MISISDGKALTLIYDRMSLAGCTVSYSTSGPFILGYAIFDTRPVGLGARIPGPGAWEVMIARRGTKIDMRLTDLFDKSVLIFQSTIMSDLTPAVILSENIIIALLGVKFLPRLPEGWEDNMMTD